MNTLAPPSGENVFQSLSPDTVLTLVEKALGIYCTNLCRPLASYINRVFELETEDDEGLVVKFYRPGRWSREALEDEHKFLLELNDREIPVIAPLRLKDKTTLGQHEGILFAVFPKCGGRSFDEYNDEQWLELGRLIGRTHAVGSETLPVDRIHMRPDRSTAAHLEYLRTSNTITPDLAPQYRDVTGRIIDEINPLFDNIEMIRIHGDCHFGNLIYRPGESFFIIDFDDMAVGPPVQDFWMLLPSYMDESFVEIDIFLEGYETFRDFDWRTLNLIEPLRAMRFIHYTAWCAHQVVEDGVTHVIPNFGTRDYWQQEINDLEDQLDRIRSTKGQQWPPV